MTENIIAQWKEGPPSKPGVYDVWTGIGFITILKITATDLVTWPAGLSYRPSTRTHYH